MRIARGKDFIGEWPDREIKERIKNGSLMPTDFYYDEEAADWLPLSEYLSRPPAPAKVEKSGMLPCYCGSHLRFQDCCGDSKQY